MKPLDRWLQRWRNAKLARCVPPGSRVLDIGCSDGALFRQLGVRLGQGVGIDPLLGAPVRGARYELLPGRFPDVVLPEAAFDVIAMAAVLEHLAEPQLPEAAAACARSLKPGGVLALTVPSPAVDRIIDLLKRCRVLDGMEDEQHHGFDVREVVPLFTGAGLRLVRARRFQLGLNHLFVFQRPPQEAGRPRG